MKFKRNKHQGLNSIVGEVNKHICKIPQNINFSIVHEHAVLTHLRAGPLARHFPAVIKLGRRPVNTNYYEKPDPFKLTRGAPTIVIEYLMLEKIDGSSLHDLLHAGAIEPRALEALAARVLLLLMLLYDLHEFTHYDLHLHNIFVRRVPRAKVVYRLINREFEMDNWGFEPVFIDFGVSYVKTLEHPGAAPAHLSNLGCIPMLGFKHADVRFFLCTMSEVLASCSPRAAAALKLDQVFPYPAPRYFIKTESMSILDYILYGLRSARVDSVLLRENQAGVVQLILYLVQPRAVRFDGARAAFAAVADEFLKIENIVSDNVVNTWIFKHVVTLTARRGELGDEECFARLYALMNPRPGMYCYPADFSLSRLMDAIEACAREFSGIVYQALELTIDEYQSEPPVIPVERLFMNFNAYINDTIC